MDDFGGFALQPSFLFFSFAGDKCLLDVPDVPGSRLESTLYIHSTGFVLMYPHPLHARGHDRKESMYVCTYVQVCTSMYSVCMVGVMTQILCQEARANLSCR